MESIARECSSRATLFFMLRKGEGRDDQFQGQTPFSPSLPPRQDLFTTEQANRKPQHHDAGHYEQAALEQD